MDTNYSYTGTARDKIPVYEDIVLRNVRIEGAGKVTVNGYDAAHPVAMKFDNVVFDDPAAIKTTQTNAEIQRLNSTRAPKNSCEDKFVPWPEE